MVTVEEVKERVADTNGYLKGLFAFGFISKTGPAYNMLEEIVNKNIRLLDRIDAEGLSGAKPIK